MGPIFLCEPPVVTSTSMGDGAVEEALTFLWANRTLLGWHPLLFSILLLAAFESEPEEGKRGCVCL